MGYLQVKLAKKLTREIVPCPMDVRAHISRVPLVDRDRTYDEDKRREVEQASGEIHVVDVSSIP